jgi:hypothetical protein
VYDRLADKEFYDVAGKKIADFMDERYNSFVASLTHVGYTRAASVPSILIITHDFLDRDAQDVVAMFGEPGCQYVKRVFCYEGDFGASADWADGASDARFFRETQSWFIYRNQKCTRVFQPWSLCQITQ